MSNTVLSPIISIVMGVYNDEKYINDVLKSLLVQTFKNFELIIVNDGSTDNSASILDAYATQDKRINVITQINSGLGAALNKGIGVARGKYIARIDADDFAYPERLEKQLNYLEQYPEVVAVGTKIMLIDPNGIPIGLKKFELDHDDIEKELLKGNGSAICHPSVMMRKSSVLQVGGYDTRWRVTEDLDFFLRLAEIGQLANLPDVLVNWRQHLGSANHSKQEQQRSEAHSVLTEAHKRRGLDFDESVITPRSKVTHAMRFERWGWNALSKGYRKVALRYAIHSLRLSPFYLPAYKLLACVIRGH